VVDDLLDAISRHVTAIFRLVEDRFDRARRALHPPQRPGRETARRRHGAIQIPDIRVQLQKLLEPREPLAATRVVTDADQYVVLDAIREDAVARHETLVDRMERRVFDLETSRETSDGSFLDEPRGAGLPAADHMRAVTLELARP